MNENQKFEFVTALLWDLVNSNYVEGLSPSDKTITMSNSENINVKIRKVNDQAEIFATNGSRQETISLPVNSLYSLLERLQLLDKKLESKLKFVFTQSTFMKSPEVIKVTIEHMINLSFPALKGNVNVKIGDDRDEVILMLKNGLEDPNFIAAFPSLILRKSFFENCKMFGVKKLVFIDEINRTFDDIEIDSYDITKLN